MSHGSRFRLACVAAATITLAIILGGPDRLPPAMAQSVQPPILPDGGDTPKGGKEDIGKGQGRKSDRKSGKAKSRVIRWGQQRGETDADYDARFEKLLKRIKREKQGDYSGGHFLNEKNEEVRFWTYKGRTFICRSDVSQEFTADLAMYMEMLHREYGEAYTKILGVPARVREPIEVIVFADRATYLKTGAPPSSGGYFDPVPFARGDRSRYWPAKHFRLVQFTDGIKDFAKWPKGTLKHEGAHMELQLRLGFTVLEKQIGFPVLSPIWWNEGQATIFEDWDFDKTVDENFAEIPNRGRYAPFIRRLYGTDEWKDFGHIWNINPATWNNTPEPDGVYTNYCYAWSLVAYMFTGGEEGHRDYRKIMDLCKRVGLNDTRKLNANHEVVGSVAWDKVFPEEDQAKIDQSWNKWVAENIPKDKRVPDEEVWCRYRNINPDVVDRLERLTDEDEIKANQKWVEQERQRRKKTTGIEK